MLQHLVLLVIFKTLNFKTKILGSGQYSDTAQYIQELFSFRGGFLTIWTLLCWIILVLVKARFRNASLCLVYIGSKMVVKGSLDIFMEVWNKIIGAYRKNGTQVPQMTQDPGPYEDPGP